MNELLDHLEYAKLLGYVSLGIMVITYIAHAIFREHRWPKYIPGLIVIVIGMYSLWTLGSDSSWIKGISNMVTILIGMGSGVMGLFFGLILGVYNKPKKIKKLKDSKEE